MKVAARTTLNSTMSPWLALASGLPAEVPVYELYGEEPEYSKTQMHHPLPYTIVHGAFRFILNEILQFTSRMAL